MGNRNGTPESVSSEAHSPMSPGLRVQSSLDIAARKAMERERCLREEKLKGNRGRLHELEASLAQLEHKLEKKTPFTPFTEEDSIDSFTPSDFFSPSPYSMTLEMKDQLSEVQRLRNELQTSKKVVEDYQRNRAKDFYQPPKGEIVDLMLKELDTYPAGLKNLFDLKDIVGEVMDFKKTPTSESVRWAAHKSGERNVRLQRRSQSMNCSALANRRPNSACRAIRSGTKWERNSPHSASEPGSFPVQELHNGCQHISASADRRQFSTRPIDAHRAMRTHDETVGNIPRSNHKVGTSGGDRQLRRRTSLLKKAAANRSKRKVRRQLDLKSCEAPV